jgi:gliding motility-associated-like protein
MSHQPGFVFPVGTTPVTITAIDNNGNSTTCSFNVTIVDTQVPTIEGCPVDVTVNTQAGACGAIVTWIQPTAFDNCPGVVVTSTHNSGDFFPLGTTTVVFTATDAVGLSVTCSYNITVVDTEAPVISNCPSAITQNVTGLACDAVVNWTPPTAADNCILQSLTSSHNPGDVFPVGVTTVIYTAVDAAGNTSTCSFPVTITDTQLPIISGCPANIIVSNDPGVCGAVVSWIPPTASDNCAGGLTFTSTHNPGALFPIGITTVTYTATDAGGNTVTCSFTVTVNDTQAPITLNCPTNINVNNTFNTCGAIVNWVPPTFTDNCSGPVTVVASHFPGATFPVGITVVTYTATDANGNVTVCSFNINVTDTQAPLIVGCPANINTTAQPGVCGASVVWTIPTILDNCPNSTLVSSHNSGSVFPVGTTVVTYTATDISGNVVTCSFTVTVTDTQVPVIAGCPANVVIPAANSSCNETATWIAPTASDNCAIQSFTSTHNPGDTFPIGTTTVTYTAVDLNGNSSTCSFTVTITDNVLPVITGCPINITVNSAPAICGAIVNWTPPTITDNCSAGLVITSTHNPGDIFPVGTTVVTYTATDGSGNSVNCSFNVTIIDSIAPVVNNCPSNITVNNTFNTCGAVVSWTPPTFTDNCNGAVNVMASHFPGTIFPIGSTVVTYTATDAAGNTSVCFFTVTVTDTQVPVFAGCPIDIVVFNEDSICGENVNWAPPVVIDNCQNVTVVASHNPGDLFPIGTTTVTYIATDAGGNSDTCSFNVTVLDKESPVISGCPGNIVINSEPGVCGANVGWIAPTATDNCGVVSLLTTNNPGSFFPVGVTTVTYSAVDAGNNVTTCVFTVTVLDVEAPVITNCPSDITVITNANSCTAVVNWIPPTVMDNCGNGNNITLVSSHANGSSFSTGTTVVTLTYTDLAGNSSVCTFNVNVIDSVPPVIVNCPSDITSCNALVTWTPPTASDNCNLVSFVSSHNPGVMFPSGNTVVTYTAIDASGNITVCSFNVFVGSPVLNIQTSNVTCYGQQNGSASVTVTSGAAPFTYDWGIGSGPVLQNLGPGFYTITVTDANGCLARDSVSITQPDSLELNIGSVSAAICGFGNGAAIITVDGGTPGYSFLWSNGATTQNLSDVSEGTYALSVTDANGCTADSLVVVIDGQFGIIPQLVTPNADGHNDTWVIPCIENYPDAVVELYNRWGNLIFKREGGYKNDWAGYSEGMLNVGNGRLPAATYFYVIKLNNDTKPLTGYIELQY